MSTVLFLSLCVMALQASLSKGECEECCVPDVPKYTQCFKQCLLQCQRQPWTPETTTTPPETTTTVPETTTIVPETTTTLPRSGASTPPETTTTPPETTTTLPRSGASTPPETTTTLPETTTTLPRSGASTPPETTTTPPGTTTTPPETTTTPSETPITMAITTAPMNITTKKPVGASARCLDCICGIESNGGIAGCGQINGMCEGNIGCNMDGGSCSCGPYQIKEIYFKDCSKFVKLPINNWVACSTNQACARLCVQCYVDRYGPFCTKKPLNQVSCQEFGRVHNGGPQGCTKANTLPYAQKVAQCCAGQC